MSDFNPILPAFLQRSAAQIEADDAQQAEYRQALHGRVVRNAEERQVARGIEIEHSVRATLEVNQADHLVSQLAEALAMQGKYSEAAVVEPDEEKTKEYIAIAEAIERDDNETCDCPQVAIETDPLTKKEVRLPTQNVTQFVFSKKHGRMMPVVSCACGSLQVAPLTNFPQLAKRQEGIAQTEARQRGR